MFLNFERVTQENKYHKNPDNKPRGTLLIGEKKETHEATVYLSHIPAINYY